MEQPGSTLPLAFLLFFVLYTTIVIYSFTCIVTHASQLQITL